MKTQSPWSLKASAGIFLKASFEDYKFMLDFFLCWYYNSDCKETKVLLQGGQ